MSALDAIKRAPRWTWYIAGGVGLGTVAIKLYQNRDAEDPEVNAGSGATVGDGAPGTVTPATTGSSPPGVIVPPIVMGGDGNSIGEIGAAFAAMVGGTITDLTDLTGRAIDANAAANQQWIGAFQDSNTTWVGHFGDSNASWIGALSGLNGQFIDALAAAGNAPQPVAQNPTPVIVNVTPPPSAAVAAPPSAAPSKPKPPNPEYPFYQEVGTRAGRWYKIVLKGGERYKYYDNGDKVKA